MSASQWITDNATYFLGVIALVFIFLWLRFSNDRLQLTVLQTAALTAATAVCGVFSIKIFCVIEHWDFSRFSGMSLFGAIFIMPLFIYIISKIIKRSAALMFDTLTVCLIFTMICGRINCIIYGCCQGTFFFGSHTFLWPVRELEIAFNLVMLFIIAFKVRKENTNGRMFPIYMIAYGIFRFLIEWVRIPEHSTVIHPGHICAAISAAAGIAVLLAMKKKENQEKKIR